MIYNVNNQSNFALKKSQIIIGTRQNPARPADQSSQVNNANQRVPDFYTQCI